MPAPMLQLSAPSRMAGYGQGSFLPQGQPAKKSHSPQLKIPQSSQWRLLQLTTKKFHSVARGAFFPQLTTQHFRPARSFLSSNHGKPPNLHASHEYKAILLLAIFPLPTTTLHLLHPPSASHNLSTKATTPVYHVFCSLHLQSASRNLSTKATIPVSHVFCSLHLLSIAMVKRKLKNEASDSSSSSKKQTTINSFFKKQEVARSPLGEVRFLISAIIFQPN